MPSLLPPRLPLALALLAVPLCQPCTAAGPDWPKADAETLRHYQAVLRMDTQNPPGNETQVVDYIRRVLESEGIPSKVLALEPNRANLVARLKGSGGKRPLLIMGHTDTVRVDPSKWKFPPFAATIDGGYVYGRGTLDDKDNLIVSMMTLILLKRLNVPLERDVIFVAEAGEEASTAVGIEFLVNRHWSEIDAEICLAEGGGVTRRGGKVRYASIQTGEKLPQSLRLVARGPAGHGSRPLKTNAVVHLARAVERVAAWQTPMRMNDTTRYYFERLAAISTPDEAARYNGLFDSSKSSAIQAYFAEKEPGHYSMLRTSISPTILKAGYQVNVIPSEAEATLDVRAHPSEDMGQFIAMMKQVIDDPQIEIVREGRNERPPARPSSLSHPAFQALEAANKAIYGAVTLPVMSTGATDMAYLRAKGVECYGIGSLVDEEDGPLGFGAHSDQERILESSLYSFLRFNWQAVTAIAGRP